MARIVLNGPEIANAQNVANIHDVQECDEAEADFAIMTCLLTRTAVASAPARTSPGREVLLVRCSTRPVTMPGQPWRGQADLFPLAFLYLWRTPRSRQPSGHQSDFARAQHG